MKKGIMETYKERKPSSKPIPINKVKKDMIFNNIWSKSPSPIGILKTLISNNTVIVLPEITQFIKEIKSINIENDELSDEFVTIKKETVNTTIQRYKTLYKN